MSGTITLEIEGRDVEIDRSFLSLSEAEQQATVEEIAGTFEPKQTVMQNVNTGIAESLGGLVDFINPFDKPEGAALLGMDFSTGSAVDGLKGGMNAIGVETTDAPPDSLLNSLGRGTGTAAGALIPGTAVAKGLAGTGGILGNAADDAYTALASRGGVTAELAAGAGGQAASDSAERAGLPVWAQNTAGLAGGLGAGLIPAAGRMSPTVFGITKATAAAKRALAPYTESGASEVARQRLQDLAGGPERARELASRVQGDEFGLTPAQQTRDPNMLAIEQGAAEVDPKLRERLNARLEESNRAATEAARLGGDPKAAQEFIVQRQEAAQDAIAKNVAAAMDRADAALAKAGPKRSEAENSVIVSDEIRRAEKSALEQEATLWGQVPVVAMVRTSSARAAAMDATARISRAQAQDVPKVIKDLLVAEDGFADQETVKEMHGLYSELRRVARSAMAGNDQNKNKARIANNVADAILEDLGAVDGSTDVGRKINQARAFSREMHEVFDRGVVGRLLKRTLDGDNQVDPQETLKRAIGPGGVTAKVGAEGIQQATIGNAADEPITDYIRRQFSERAVDASGKDKTGAGQKFVRDNADLIAKYPQLEAELRAVLGAQGAVAARTGRADTLNRSIGSPSASAAGRFASGPPDKAIDAIFKADNPAAAARSIIATARKDQTGAALDGVKGALSARLIQQARKPNGETSRGGRGISGQSLSWIA